MKRLIGSRVMNSNIYDITKRYEIKGMEENNDRFKRIWIYRFL